MGQRRWPRHNDGTLGWDRSGLRPMRYSVTTDGLFICGSETGMVGMPEDRIIERGRLGPGKMIAVNLAEGRLYHNDEIKAGAPIKCLSLTGWATLIT